MLTLFALTLLLGVVWYVMTPEERRRFLRGALPALRQAKVVAARGRAECEPFNTALRERTAWPIVTLLFLALHISVYYQVLSAPGAVSDDTLVAWGANIGTRTTNGEWWRLVSSTFVHGGFLHLLATIAGLAQLGLMLERLVGPLAFGSVYVAAGVLAGLVSLSGAPLVVSAGASGAIYGLYGLLLASLIWVVINRSTITIPLMAVQRLLPAAVVFFAYNVFTDIVPRDAESVGFLAGFVCGVVLTARVSERKPMGRRVATATAAMAVIAVTSAVAHRQLVDIRPEIARLVAVEARIAGAYNKAVDRFRRGTMSAEALAQLIDRTIVPELSAGGAQLKVLGNVPPEDQPLVAGAYEYLRLRAESWRLRAEGLRKSNLVTLRRAEHTERASLIALERIRTPDQH